ncbi:MAG TPA: Ada metal-binding domain-containing protein [Niastella sp.]|nr:Ada metal-binding domain-containing protein [Niastella sp.]
MIRHIELGNDVAARQAAVWRLIHNKEIGLGGYGPGKIYGTLRCASGKRVKAKNRVFFKNEAEAIAAGYRPCAHCMREKYLKWKLVRS